MAYSDTITAATGVTDPATLALLEELMRIQSRTLDGLDAGAFRDLARTALEAAAVMSRSSELANFCAAYQLPLPGTSTPAPTVTGFPPPRRRPTDATR